MLGTLNSPQIQWEQGMPRVAQDSQLAERVQAFVKACGGFGNAAERLEMDRSSLWRFCQSGGRAIERTRSRLIEGLAREDSATSQTENATLSVVSGVTPEIPLEDLARMRAFFQTMVALVDAYTRASPRLPQDQAQALDARPN